MKYIVEKLNEHNEWIRVAEYQNIKEANEKAHEIAGIDCYIEPSLKLNEAYFGTKNANEPWICKIEVV